LFVDFLPKPKTKGKKRRLKNPLTAAQRPNPDENPTALRGSKSARSLEARQKRDDDFLQKRLQYYKENVPTIKLSFSLENMLEDKDKLEDICNDELKFKSPQCFSAKFVDINDRPVLFYFGLRHPEKKKCHVGFVFIPSLYISLTDFKGSY
jgi:hypothetical protein